MVPGVEDSLPAESVIPRTPSTSVSIESCMTLQNIIMKRDVCTLGTAGKQDLERHLQARRAYNDTVKATWE
jgi:hypothetical protein